MVASRLLFFLFQFLFNHSYFQINALKSRIGFRGLRVHCHCHFHVRWKKKLWPAILILLILMNHSYLQLKNALKPGFLGLRVYWHCLFSYATENEAMAAT